MPNSAFSSSSLRLPSLTTRLSAVICGALLCVSPIALCAQSVSFAGPNPSVNFGTVNVCAPGRNTPAPCSVTMSLSYNVTVGGTLGTPNVLLLGAPDLDFTLASGSTCTGSVTTGTTCTVNVTFAARAPGARNGAVEILDGSGNVLANTYVYGSGTGPAIAFTPSPQTTLGAGFTFGEPFGVAVDGSGNVFVGDSYFNAVFEILAAGGYTTVNTLPASGLGYGDAVYGVAVDGNGNVFVAGGYLNWVKEILAAGGYTTVTTLGSGFSYPTGVAVDGSGNVFVANYNDGNGTVNEILAAGGYSTVLTLASGFNFGYVDAVAVDRSDNVFVGGYAVYEILAAGGYTTVKTLASGPLALGVAVDASGNVFVAEQAPSAVTEIVAVNGSIPANPTITNLGSGWADPTAVAIDRAGNLFVTDYETLVAPVVEIQRSEPPALAFLQVPVGSSDSPQAVTVQNIGNAALTAIAPGLSVSANFEQVKGTGTPADCTASFSLAPAAECNLSLTFMPTEASPKTGAATLTDNALNANPATQSILLSGTLLTQTITFNAISSPQFLGGSISLVATASSGLPVSFASLTPDVCFVSSTTATLSAIATCTIEATQPGDSAYAPASPVDNSFQVISAVTFNAIPSPQIAGTAISLVATSASGLPVSFSSYGVCTVSGTTANLSAAGTCTILAGDGVHAPVSQSFQVLSASAAFDAINFSGGFSGAGSALQLNGATIVGNTLELTNGGVNEATSAFATAPVNIQAFTTDFTFQILNPVADGFTFAIQRNEPGAVGQDGGGLGYGHIRNSVAVKFDIYNNLGEGTDSTGLYTDGASPTIPAIDLSNTGINLRSGDSIKAHITYDGTYLTMTLADTVTMATWSYVWAINIPATVGGSTAYVGFTGATGADTSTETIASWTYLPGTPPPNYPVGFFNTAGLQLNGSGEADAAAKAVLLTEGGTDEVGSAFYRTPQSIQAFTTDFTFQIVAPGADGFTFTIQNDGPDALGQDGGGLGYGHIGKSVAIKFDLFNNLGEGPDSTGLYTDGASPTVPAIDLTGTGINLHSVDIFHAHVTYDGTNLIMTLTDTSTLATFSHSWAIDIPGTVGGTTAYIGFTAATGGLTSTDVIFTWSYLPAVP